MKRVVYRHSDGNMRVLIGKLTPEQAEAIAARWADSTDANYFLGKEVRAEECDGTPDGEILRVAGAA